MNRKQDLLCAKGGHYFEFLYFLQVKHSDISAEHAASIFRATELVRSDAEVI